MREPFVFDENLVENAGAEDRLLVKVLRRLRAVENGSLDIAQRRTDGRRNEALQRTAVGVLTRKPFRGFGENRKISAEEMRRSSGGNTDELIVRFVALNEKRCRHFEAGLKKKYGKDVVFDRKYGEKTLKVDLNNPFAMMKVWSDLLGMGKKLRSAKKAVAVVYVDGAITILRGVDLSVKRTRTGGRPG